MPISYLVLSMAALLSVVIAMVLIADRETKRQIDDLYEEVHRLGNLLNALNEDITRISRQ